MQSNGNSAASSEPLTDSDSDDLLGGWHLALGKALAEERGQWARERALIEAQAQAAIAELRAQNAELRARFERDIAQLLATLRNGEPGEAGPQGQRGERGFRGERGEPGAKGEQGEPGARGEKGDRGEPGLPGEPGVIGERGEKGEQGEPGAQGERGRDGADGEPGAPGAPGEVGAAGPQGPQGERGERGIIGARGERGLMGEAGKPGADGKNGEQGERGEQGEAGPQGERGPVGYLPKVKPWKPETVFYENDVVRHDKGSYQALKDTAQEPPHADWICIARTGHDGRSPIVRSTYDPNRTDYKELDIVALKGSGFIARRDDPGPCPGDGWQLIASAGSVGRPGVAGERGEKGERGERGERGLPGPSLVRGEIDKKTYTMKFVMSDGNQVAVNCRGFFEQYHEESDG